VTLGRVLLVTGLLAALISLQHTLARYLFAFGREHLLPTWLGRTALRTSVPRAASLTQSAIAAAAIAACAALRFDPTGWLVARLAVAGGLGVLVLLLATSLAALLHLNRTPNGENAWQRFVAPGLASVALGAIVYLAWVNLPALLGVRSDDPQALIVPGAVAALLVLGILQALTLRGARPVVYAGIGLGGTAVVVAPRIPQPRMPGAHRPERVDR
jgi:amino acid transporter